ncbi:hypothetical protein ACO2Q8_07550 [Larkinella sp. VNQ87]|uniref:hypothetical protein n=1 Tax=Larkinella sp. VNQ87 TaxID=3400921 RepID=UPI003BFB5114
METIAIQEPFALIRQTDQIDIKPLKIGIWFYFLLLIFEGSLRKWFLAPLATPLLVVRDPIAMWLIYHTWKKYLFPPNIYTFAIITITLIGILTTLLFGHGNLFVALFGARIFLHFPLMFVIGRIFNRQDVIRLGIVILWLAIPMTVLLALQFYSPQSAWVNRGVGGDESGSGFSGALGYFRPSATFSFTNGTSMFYGFLGAYIVYFWVSFKQVNRLLLLASTVSLLMAIPLSISRGLFFQIGVSVLFACLAMVNKPKSLVRIVVAAGVITVALYFLQNLSYFQTATEAFLSRFEVANKVEGGVEGVLLDRYLGGLVEALSSSVDQPFFGYGMGMGTNVGSMLLTGGTTFLISEGEWGRLIGEMGPLFGLLVIFIRLIFCAKITLAAVQRLQSGEVLPWMLLSFGLLIIPQGQWAQPTSLGFSTLIGGLMIASFRQPK